MVFWPFMNVTKKVMDDILGIKPGVSFAEIRLRGAKQERQLDDFIKAHHKAFQDQGKPFIYVNQRLVNLGSGTGFGELALMSDITRMASVRTTCNTTLATMSRKEFTAVLRKAMKRKQQRACEFLRKFIFFEKFTRIKL